MTERRRPGKDTADPLFLHEHGDALKKLHLLPLGPPLARSLMLLGALTLAALTLAAVSAAAPTVRVSLKGGGTSAVVGTPWRATLVVQPAKAGRPVVTIRGPRVRTAPLRRLAAGRYRLEVRFDAAGAWRIEARLRGRSFVLRRVVATQPAGAPVVLRGAAQVVFDADGHLVVAENDSNRIERIDPATGRVTLVAEITSPFGIAIAGNRDLYVTSDNQLLRIRMDGTRTVVARSERGLDIGPVVVNHDADVFFFADGRIYRLETRTGTVTTYGGTGTDGFGGDGTTVDQATFGRPHGLAMASDGALIVADSENGRVRRVDPATRVVTTIASGLGFLGGIAVGPDDSVYVVQVEARTVRRVAPDGTVTLVAGTGSPGSSGDGGPGASAALDRPTAVAVAGDGSVYITEYGSGHIRVIDPAGTIRTLAFDGPPSARP